jgi:pimeloyl-ACP methyl ester carboxylesterase
MEVSSTDSVTVAVHDLGGAGDPLLLCHATGFLGWAYKPLADELVHRFHVWALDFRGHGDSTPPSGGRFDWDGMADDLCAAIEAIAAGPIDVFGHSLGGGTAMLAEHRRPGTLRTAYLFEPIVLPGIEGMRPDDPNAMSDAARRRHPTFPSKAEALYRYASRPPLQELRAEALFAYVDHGFTDLPDGTVQLKCLPEHEAATFEAGGKPTLETVAAVNTPTTVAVGTVEQGWTPAMFGPDIADALPNGRLERHPTLGHFGPLQDPTAVADGILRLTAEH